MESAYKDGPCWAAAKSLSGRNRAFSTSSPTAGSVPSLRPTTANTHNVREDSKLFRSGPLTDSGTYHIVPSAGTYHYYCESHGSENGGMDGVLKEIPVAGPRNADFFTVGWAPAEDTDTGDQFDVRYKVEDGEWKTWFKNTDKIGWKFGRNDKPIDVKPNKTYRIQARSELHSNPSKHSGFSPSLVVGPVT